MRSSSSSTKTRATSRRSPPHRELAGLDERLGHPVATQNLLSLYRLNNGPIAVTLDNAREPFLPVERQVPGRNVYPAGITREEVDAFLSAHPDARESILHERTVVRRATRREHHPRPAGAGERSRSARCIRSSPVSSRRSGARPDPKRLYAAPYAAAYAGAADACVPAPRCRSRCDRAQTMRSSRGTCGIVDGTCSRTTTRAETRHG